MIDISLSKNRELYTDYEKCLEFLRQVDVESYDYPDEKTIFHIYTEVKNEKELMAVKSFLATQDLEKSELWIWSDYHIDNNPLMQRFKDHVHMKIYRPLAESTDTIMYNHPHKLMAKDPKYYLQSDLFRLLVLHKYGGIFYDMDVILLRDFLPIMDQEFLYMWGSELDFARDGCCATVIGLNQGSELSERFLQGIIDTPARPCTPCWGKEMFADVYRKGEYTIFPSTFFNTEWHINVKTPGLGTAIESGWFKKNEFSSKYKFLEAFAWHWHNTSFSINEIEKGSKFNLLQNYIEEKLLERGI